MPNKNSEFLGGGPQFNKVGAGVTDDGTQEAAPIEPQGLQPYQIRNAIIIVVVIIMFCVLFAMSDHMGFETRSKGHSGPVQEKPEIPRNF